MGRYVPKQRLTDTIAVCDMKRVQIAICQIDRSGKKRLCTLLQLFNILKIKRLIQADCIFFCRHGITSPFPEYMKYT